MRGLSRARHGGAGQDLHAERGGVSGRVVRIRGGEGHAGHRRRDRRQRRPALAGHGLHPAASLHGRRGRPSRAVGIRARRHGRGVGSDRGIGARRGVEIRTNAPVAKILVRDGRGARRGAGERRGDRGADRWRRNLDPKLTFLRLLDAQDLPAEFVARDPQFPHRRHVAARSTWRSTACRSFTALPRRARPAAPGDDAHLPVIEYVERAWDDAKYGRAIASARCWS